MFNTSLIYKTLTCALPLRVRVCYKNDISLSLSASSNMGQQRRVEGTCARTHARFSPGCTACRVNTEQPPRPRCAFGLLLFMTCHSARTWMCARAVYYSHCGDQHLFPHSCCSGVGGTKSLNVRAMAWFRVGVRFKEMTVKKQLPDSLAADFTWMDTSALAPDAPGCEGTAMITVTVTQEAQHMI